MGALLFSVIYLIVGNLSMNAETSFLRFNVMRGSGVVYYRKVFSYILFFFGVASFESAVKCNVTKFTSPITMIFYISIRITSRLSGSFLLKI